MIDQNRDGFIDAEDLKDMLASLGNNAAICHVILLVAGQEPNDEVVEQMMAEPLGPLNFTMFLTLFGEKLTGTLCGYCYVYIASCMLEMLVYCRNRSRRCDS